MRPLPQELDIGSDPAPQAEHDDPFPPGHDGLTQSCQKAAQVILLDQNALGAVVVAFLDKHE